MAEIKKLSELSAQYLDKPIKIFGRVQSVRNISNIKFIILRDSLFTLQCVGNGEMETFHRESIVELTGKLIELPKTIKKIKSCSFQTFEFKIDELKLINGSAIPPIQVEDANQLFKEAREQPGSRPGVNLTTRLDNRVLELRAPLYHSIFKIQSAICELFRTYLYGQGFMEIHSPKIIGTVTECGSSVFELKYFDSVAYLAQSPQLYKQMCINADFGKVFEVGPVFRAENSFTHRHLCEFTGIDFEFELDYPFKFEQIITTLWNALTFIFNEIETNPKYTPFTQCIRQIVGEGLLTPLSYTKDPLILKFSDGVKLLREGGFEQQDYKDLDTENEKALGQIVKEKFGVDLFVLTEYPKAVRPFYTMEIDHTEYSYSFDVIMRGEEICSGAQREHNYDKLINKLTLLKMSQEPLSDYLNSFKYGSKPHGGCGFGLERILMLYFNLLNVRVTSLFPRDPTRLTP